MSRFAVPRLERSAVRWLRALLARSRRGRCVGLGLAQPCIAFIITGRSVGSCLVRAHVLRSVLFRVHLLLIALHARRGRAYLRVGLGGVRLRAHQGDPCGHLPVVGLLPRFDRLLVAGAFRRVVALLSAVDAEVPRARQLGEQIGGSPANLSLVLRCASSSSLGFSVLEPAVGSVLARPSQEVAAVLLALAPVRTARRPVPWLSVSALLTSLLGVASSCAALRPRVDVTPAAPVSVSASSSQVELAYLL